MAVVKRALILGVAGQDGSYLAELLLSKGYEVHGLYRRSSCDNLWRIAGVRDWLTLHVGDLLDVCSVQTALAVSAPDEVYNLADQDHVGSSRFLPGYSTDVTGRAVGELLESCRMHNRTLRVFQACSATMFQMDTGPLNEDSPHDPRSPYAVAKCAAYHLVRHYRRDHGLYVATGIFFQHSSPRQSPDYLLPTIARQAVDVARGKRDRVELTGPDRPVDVGWAPEYVRAAWLALQQSEPDDYVIGTGLAIRPRELAAHALAMAGCETIKEVGLTDPARPPERLQANPAKANRVLRWYGETWCWGVLRQLVDHYKEDARCV